MSSGPSSKTAVKAAPKKNGKLDGSDIAAVFLAVMFVILGMVVFQDDIRKLNLIGRFIDAPVSAPTLTINGAGGARTYMLELAITREEKAKGLMNRKALAPDNGMLFVEAYPRIVKMWMRNTYIPLDMLFFDGSGKIVYIHENAKPFDESAIGPDFPVMAVLELSGGTVKKHGLRVGDTAADITRFFGK